MQAAPLKPTVGKAGLILLPGPSQDETVQSCPKRQDYFNIPASGFSDYLMSVFLNRVLHHAGWRVCGEDTCLILPCPRCVTLGRWGASAPVSDVRGSGTAPEPSGHTEAAVVTAPLSLPSPSFCCFSNVLHKPHQYPGRTTHALPGLSCQRRRFLQLTPGTGAGSLLIKWAH